MNYYTTAEVAKILRLHPQTIRKLADKGELPKPLMLGATARWPKEAIDSLAKRV